MLATLVDHLPEPPMPARIRLRERRHPCGLFIRKVKGYLYQLRWWLQGYGSINCGLYDEDDAELVRKELIPETGKHPATSLGIWQALMVVLDRLRHRKPGTHWPEVLPKWVRPHPDGGFFGRVKIAGKIVETPKTYRKAEDAHRAMAEMLGCGRAVEVEEGPRWLTLLDLSPACRKVERALVRRTALPGNATRRR